MKTNYSDVTARALRVTSLQIAVLPLACVSPTHATPVIGDQIPANPRPHTISNDTTRLFKTSRVEVDALRFASRARVAKSSCQPRKPRGMRLRVRGYFDVTNSDDGFRDNDVEVFGIVNLNGQPIWKVARQNAVNATNKGRKIYTSDRTFDVIYDNPSTWNLIVSGYMNDRDSGSKDDAMWNSYSIPRVINLKKVSDRLTVIGDGEESTLLGDRDSESADLHLFFTRSSDIF